MAPLRILIWGAGFFGRKWLQAVQARPDCRLAGVISRSPARLDEVRRELGPVDVPAYAGLEEATARGQADAVIVALPEMLHREAILNSLGAGLHVLTEKPLAMSMDEARTIWQATRAHPDRVVMVNQNFRWRPHTLALRRAIQDGSIGRPGYAAIECRQRILRQTVDGWREKMSEPFLLDYAIHHLDLIRYLTGQEAKEVVGLSFQPAWSWYSGNAAAAAIVTMQDGLVMHYGGTMVSQGFETPQEGIITLIGDQGTLHLDDRSQVSLFREGEHRAIAPQPVPEGELGHGLTEFIDAIRTRRLPETHVEDNARSLALLLAILESARRHEPVRLAGLLTFLG